MERVTPEERELIEAGIAKLLAACSFHDIFSHEGEDCRSYRVGLLGLIAARLGVEVEDLFYVGLQLQRFKQ